MKIYTSIKPTPDWIKRAIRERDEEETLEMLAWQASLKLKCCLDS